MGRLISLTALAVLLGCLGARAQYTDGIIKIGVMNDMSGTYADLSGQGSVIAARMAVEGFGAATKGTPCLRRCRPRRADGRRESSRFEL